MPDVVFVWIPKNAGTSIWEILKTPSSIKLGNIWQTDEPKINRINKRKSGIITTGHLNFPEIYHRHVIDRYYLDNAFKFAVVRNPWDRAVSLYTYLKINDSFKKFCHQIDDYLEPLLITSNAHGYSQANPQVKWIYDENGKLLVDHIIRFEDIEQELPKVLKKTGIEVKRVPHLNSRKRRNYREFYDLESKDLIASIYKEDIERFDYTF